MYSFDNLYKFGIQKTIFSLQTLLFGLSGVIEQKPNTFGTIIFFLYLVIGSYVNFFNYLKSNNQPTPALYKTKFPVFAYQMLSYYIVLSFIVSVYMKFIK